jgi:uncharacterized phage-associated protein
MSYPASAIANYYLRKALASGKTLSPMKLIKLVYLAHGWYLALKDEPLVDENAVALPYGPAFQSIYYQFKKYGNEGITECALIDNVAEESLEEDEITLAILDRVWDVYACYSAIQLANLTHEKDSPWYKVRQDRYDTYNPPIDNKLIKDHFSLMADN